jgi:hypothetical protein
VQAVGEANGNNIRAQHAEWFKFNAVKDKLRHGAAMQGRGILEGVVKRLSNAVLDLGLAIKRHWPTEIKLHQSQIIKAEDMVGMFMCVKHAVDQADFLAKQLSAKIGRRID